jgi:uncharacterized membrane protein
MEVSMLVRGQIVRTQALSRRQRIRPIDAARGSAMLFVFFSHFVEVFFKRYSIPVDLAYVITQIASPAFVSISGIVLGILFSTRHDKYPVTKFTFFWRGVFLLTLGRMMIFVAHIPMAGGWQEAARWGFMTDAIGFCIILGPFLMEKVNRYERLLLGVFVYTVTWGVILFWRPVSIHAIVLKESFFGSLGTAARFFTDVFPVLPWFGFYLAATSLGEFLADFIKQERLDRLRVTILRTALIALCLALSLFTIRSVLGRFLVGPIKSDVYALLSPWQKLPPGPVYFLFYGGWTFVLMFVLFRLQHTRVVGSYSLVVEVLGRNSLFVFIVQYFVYFALFPFVDFPKSSLWPLYFTISAFVIWGLALLWDVGQMNRYLVLPGLGSKNTEANKN